MDDALFENLFFAVVLLAWFGFKVLQASRKKQNAGGVGLSPPAAANGRTPAGGGRTPAGGGRTPAGGGRVAGGRRARQPAAGLDDIDLALQNIAEQLEATRSLTSGLGRQGVIIDGAIRESVEAPYKDIAGRWLEVRRLLDDGTAVSNLARHVDTTSRWVGEFHRRLALLRSLADARRVRSVAAYLDDADAVAAAFLRPFAEFADARDIRLPSRKPITVPAGTSTEAWATVLPGHPVIGVPNDFGGDLFWWTSVPHELAHLLWEGIPGLADEFYASLGLSGTHRLLDPDREHIQDLAHRLVRAWGPELFADWMTVLQAGPAAVHGMIHVFEDARRPGHVTAVRVTSDGDYDEHPPSHLRLLVACRVLERMGFQVEAEAMKRRWLAAHGDLVSLQVPLAGRRTVEYDAEALAEYVAAFAKAFYEHQFDALAGYSVQSVHGAEMSPGMWSRARRFADRLVEGAPFRADARIVVAAAMEARYHHPEATATIRATARDAIVGANAPLRDRSVRRGPRSGRRIGKFTRDEFRDALVLGDVAERRRPGAPASRTR